MKTLTPEMEAKMDEVKRWLFDGDQMIIAKRSGKTRSYVNLVVNKKRFNKEVFAVAVEVMNENKRLFEVNTMKVAI